MSKLDDLYEKALANARTSRKVLNARVSGADRKKVARVISDWRNHVRPFEDTEYWSKRFAPYEEVFAKTRPKIAELFYRNERTDIDNQYERRFTSWSWSPDDVSGFGWGKRRMVMVRARPRDVLVDVSALGTNIDRDGMREVILRPGRYLIKPYKEMSPSDAPDPMAEEFAALYGEYRDGRISGSELAHELRKLAVEYLGERYKAATDDALLNGARKEWEKRVT